MKERNAISTGEWRPAPVATGKSVGTSMFSTVHIVGINGFDASLRCIDGHGMLYVSFLFVCLFVRFVFVSAAGARESGGNGWQNVQAIFLLSQRVV